MTRKPDPDRRVMEIARLIEKPLADMVSNRIRCLDALIQHAMPDGMSVSIRYTPSDEAHSWRLEFRQDGKELHHTVWTSQGEGALEHAIRVIPELVRDIKRGRRTMDDRPKEQP